jgi:hypothetical protein
MFFLKQNLYFLGPIVFQLVLSIFQCIKNLGAKYVTAVSPIYILNRIPYLWSVAERETYAIPHVYVLEFSVPL